MNTKFILHGGDSSNISEKNELFYKTVIESVENDILNILCVYFARPEHKWQDSFAEDKYQFNNVETNKTLELNLADTQQETFIKQLSTADIVFINGGMKGVLKETLKAVDNLNGYLGGKTVVGISAGAHMLSKYYYSSVSESILKGIGTLNIKTYCHYKKDDQEIIDALKAYEEELPIYKIPEEEFVIIEQEI